MRRKTKQIFLDFRVDDKFVNLKGKGNVGRSLEMLKHHYY